MTAFDDNNAKQLEIYTGIFDFLDESGVASQSIHEIQKLLPVATPVDDTTTDAASNVPRIGPLNAVQPGEPTQTTKSAIMALEAIQEYTKCYSSMDVPVLIRQLFDAWEGICAINHAARQQLNRRLMTMKMDPKADPIALEHLEKMRDEYADSYTTSNIGFYRMRVLRNVYDGKR